MQRRPRWLIYNTVFSTGGGRLPKWQPWVDPKDTCVTCKGKLGVQKHWVEAESWECHTCWMPSRSPVVKWEGYGPRYMAGANKVVTIINVKGYSQLGNLDNWMYRFYVGTEFESGCFSICRCCRKALYSHELRLKHKGEFTPGCTERLISAYRWLIPMGMCCVCQEKTQRQEYGVPICSDGCMSRWKFNHDTRWILLEKALKATNGWIEPEGTWYRGQDWSGMA